MNSKTVMLAVAVLAVAAVACLALSMTHPEQEDDGRTFPEDVPAECNRFWDPDEAYAEYSGSVDSMRETLASDASAEEMCDSVIQCWKDYMEIEGKYSWSKLHRYREPAEYAEAFLPWDTTIRIAADDFNTTIRDALAGDNGDAVTEAVVSIGVDPATFLAHEELSDETRALVQRASELSNEYSAIMAAEYSVQYRGRIWTASEAEASPTLTDTEKALIVRDILIERYEDAAEVYIDLVAVNNDVAESLGFDNYIDYAYTEIYDRDYSPEDVESLYGYASNAVAFNHEIEDYIASPGFDHGSILPVLDYGGDEYLEVMKTVAGGIGDEYLRLVEYMDRNGLLFLDAEEGQLPVSFTTSLREYNSAYISLCPDSLYGMVVACHEMGHAANMCLNTDHTDNFDIMEIHSQGMESILASMLDGILPSGSAEYSSLILYSMNLQVVIASILTEFEIWAFETEDSGAVLTVDTLISKFREICDRNGYNMDYGAGDSGYGWIEVPHLFESPMYYVSYGVSALNAMEIYVMCEEDMDKGVAAYRALTEQNGIDNYTVAMERAGLSNVLVDGNGDRIITTMRALFAEQHA